VDTSRASIEIRGRRWEMRQRGAKGYSEEFRREAVRLTESGTKSLAQIARELGIHLQTLRGWRRRSSGAAQSETASGVVPSLEEENRRLRRENARLLEEREILKKATAFFAKGAR
jgi:transposase